MPESWLRSIKPPFLASNYWRSAKAGSRIFFCCEPMKLTRSDSSPHVFVFPLHGRSRKKSAGLSPKPTHPHRRSTPCSARASTSSSAVFAPAPRGRARTGGLSRSPALNQHPSQHTPRLGSPLRADEVWLRVENQIFFRLPETGGLLFGIRIENASLSDVKKWPDAARGLPRALRTMPEEIARYKGIITAREEIAPLL